MDGLWEIECLIEDGHFLKIPARFMSFTASVKETPALTGPNWVKSPIKSTRHPPKSRLFSFAIWHMQWNQARHQGAWVEHSSMTTMESIRKPLDLTSSMMLALKSPMSSLCLLGVLLMNVHEVSPPISAAFMELNATFNC